MQTHDFRFSYTGVSGRVNWGQMAEIESALLDSLNTFLASAKKRLNDLGAPDDFRQVFQYSGVMNQKIRAPTCPAIR